MALYCQNMLQIALELAAEDPVYVEQAQTYFEHFAWIAAAVNHATGSAAMWDEEDGFFYDLLRLPDGNATRLRVRSMVGLLPLAAATVFEPALIDRHPEIIDGGCRLPRRAPRVSSVLRRGPVRRATTGTACWRCSTRRGCAASSPGCSTRTSSSARTESGRCRGTTPSTRSSSTWRRPYSVAYLPAESDSGMFGGNSNWRGPVWFPVNALMIRALLNLYVGYGDDFTVECPTGSGTRDDAVRGGAGDLRPAYRGLPARRRRPPALLRRPGRLRRASTGAT